MRAALQEVALPVFDIATMGSSLTAGNAISRSWHRELRNALLPGKSEEIRTYNFGIGGADIDDAAPVADKVILLRPRVITIEYSMNDCQLDFTHVRTATIALLEELKAGTPDSLIYLMTMNPVVGSSLSATSRSNLGIFYQMYRDLAVSEDVGLIDTNPDWGGVTVAGIPDGIHPLADTNKDRLIPAMVEALTPLIG